MRMKRIGIILMIFVCLFLGACSMSNSKDTSGGVDTTMSAVKVGEISDAFAASNGQIVGSSKFEDESATITGGLNDSLLDSSAKVMVTPKGNIEGVIYSFIIEKDKSHQESLIEAQNDYVALQHVVAAVDGTEGFAGDLDLPDDFISDFLNVETNSLEKHYGGNFGDDVMQDISFNDDMIRIAIGHRSKG